MNKTFTITRTLINISFFSLVVITFFVICIHILYLFQSDADLSKLPDAQSIDFKVMTTSSVDKVDHHYDFLAGKKIAVEPLTTYLLHTAYRSSLGVLGMTSNTLLLLAGLYILWNLRKIFYAISLKVPFQEKNARRIRNIGLMLIAIDLFRLLQYLVVTFLLNRYFDGAHYQLSVTLGGNLLLGLILLPLSVVYKKGTEIYTENQLTV